MTYPIFIPMFIHILWVAILYGLLTLFRAPTVWGLGPKRDETNPYEKIKRKVSANLSNQFEWPIFFYIICLLVILTGEESNQKYLWLAWLFIAGRLSHSFVHIITDNIRLRGLVFTINFLAVLGMWTLFLLGQINIAA